MTINRVQLTETDILEKELRKRKLAFNEVMNEENIKKILKDLKVKDLDDIYLSIGTLIEIH